MFHDTNFCDGVLLSLAIHYKLLLPGLKLLDLLNMGVWCTFAQFAPCCAHAVITTDAGSAFFFQSVYEVCTHQYAMSTIYLRMLLKQKLEMTLPRIYKRKNVLKS